MWPKRQPQIRNLASKLISYSSTRRDLPGIASDPARLTLATQMVASLRRLDYTRILQSRSIDPRRMAPDNALFDPERAAILQARLGNIDEAFWLLFLATHFGKHGVHGWRRVRDAYSGLESGIWTWERVSCDKGAFRQWLATNEARIKGAFGNHRKYETLRSDSRASTATVVESYIDWVGPERSHAVLCQRLIREGGNDPHSIFDKFYTSMNVARFGRLAKFDFLALIGRLDLAPIGPGAAYLKEATGPLRGARLLFGGSSLAAISADNLEQELTALDAELQVGMQVLEDSLCNWQKSPTRFVHFRG